MGNPHATGKVRIRLRSQGKASPQTAEAGSSEGEPGRQTSTRPAKQRTSSPALAEERFQAQTWACSVGVESFPKHVVQSLAMAAMRAS